MADVANIQIRRFAGNMGASAAAAVGCLAVFLLCGGVRAGALHVPGEYETIQQAIDAAAAGDTVYVAAGRYVESVRMKDGVDLQGAGAEAAIIDAPKKWPPTSAVVYGASHCTLDGFTVTGYIDDDINGVFCSGVEGLTISHNFIRDCTVDGIYVGSSSVLVCNNVIVNNRCAGIFCVGEASRPAEIINNTICGNSNEADLTVWGGASALAANNIIGDVDLWEGSVTLIRNNVLYQEHGGTNISVEPLFVDAAGRDYHLKSQAGRWDAAAGAWVSDDVTSACIDAGDYSSPIMYEPFPNGGRINLGAYGGTGEASKSYFGRANCRTIVAGDINGDCRINLVDLAIMAAHWLEEHAERS